MAGLKKKRVEEDAAPQDVEIVKEKRKKVKTSEPAEEDPAPRDDGEVKKKKKKKEKATEESSESKPAKKRKAAAEEEAEPTRSSSTKTKKKATLEKDDMMKLAEEASRTSEIVWKTWEFKASKDLKEMPQTKIDEFLSSNAITVSNAGDEFRPIMEFSHASFPSDLAEALSTFPRPTPIQGIAWEPIFRGRDLVGIAATGSGKTLAFGIPALLFIKNKLAEVTNRDMAKRKIRALILSPTRELATQIQESIESFGSKMGIKSVVLYGGTNKGEQIKLLRQGADMVVATPGRLMDLVNDELCDLSEVGYFVLDEADRMLDKGFEPEIRKIAGELKRKDLQTVMFSATWPPDVRKLSDQYLKDPVHITIGSKDLSANSNITQKVEVLEPAMKRGRLLALLKDYHKTRKNKIIIFGLYKKEVEQLDDFLRQKGYRVQSLQGNLSQDRRTEAISAFKSGTCPLLIATDVAGRGIDIPDVEYVINYTYPLTTEDYCHRIGRTGRAGKKGVAHTFFTSFDKAHSGSLINVLKQAGQEVPAELMKFGTTVKKKLDPTYGAFTREIDPNAKSVKIKFDDNSDDDE
ncbi:hypothetical protein HDU67_001929 [Dinochytrium kinnereticum]|nr:hypothetical protein HDU67_001929 [Dinochytrium kinnereticum]